MAAGDPSGAIMPAMNDYGRASTGDIFEPNEPKVPPGTWIALVTGVAGLLAAYGLPVPVKAEEAIVQIVTALVIVIPFAESYLRGKRNDRHATVTAAELAATAVTNTNQEA